ncbi:MAG: FAD:protein FMN transferase [Acidimicrobiales bacterium]
MRTGPIVHAEEVMGTVVSITVYGGAAGDDDVRSAIDEACQLLHRHDETFSTWKSDSPMSRLRRGEISLAQAPPDVSEVLDLCRQARRVSGGWFDPWAMPGGVDPTGLVKGWALHKALDVLRTAGVGSALLNAGGDLVSLNKPPGDDPWRIGIRHPWNPEALACIIELDGAIATSGSYERGLHLVDPRSGQPTIATASATVSGPSLAMADALATALAVGGDEVLERIADLDGYDGYLIRLDGSEDSTATMAFAR